jgi:hypothetical protein
MVVRCLAASPYLLHRSQDQRGQITNQVRRICSSTFSIRCYVVPAHVHREYTVLDPSSVSVTHWTGPAPDPLRVTQHDKSKIDRHKTYYDSAAEKQVNAGSCFTSNNYKISRYVPLLTVFRLPNLRRLSQHFHAPTSAFKPDTPAHHDAIQQYHRQQCRCQQQRRHIYAHDWRRRFSRSIYSGQSLVIPVAHWRFVTDFT